MHVDNGTSHVMARRLLVAFLIAVLSLVALSRQANADTTPQTCDLDVKYWCYWVTYTPYSGGVTLSTRFHEGNLGNGGAVWWQRYITQDWHFDGTSWSFLGGWAPGSSHYNAAWEVDSIAASRSIDNEAVVRLQNRYQASGTGNIYCDGYIDWHITDTGSYWSQGPYGCLTPVY